MIKGSVSIISLVTLLAKMTKPDSQQKYEIAQKHANHEAQKFTKKVCTKMALIFCKKYGYFVEPLAKTERVNVKIKLPIIYISK